MEEQPEFVPRFGRTAIVALITVGLADFLFFQQPLGWTLGLFAVVLLGGMLWTNERRWAKSPLSSALIAATVLASASLVIHPNGPGIILAVLSLLAIAVLSRCRWVVTIGDWIDWGVNFVILGWTTLISDIHATIAAESDSDSSKSTNVVKTLLRFSPIVILTLVFVALFSQANPLIEERVDHLITLLRQFLEGFLPPDLSRIALWAIVLFCVWALMSFRPTERWLIWPDFSPSLARSHSFFLTPQTITLALAVFNIIFAVQNSLDIGYLWGGATLPEGMTYAAYAHRGAYPLIVTALLAGAFTLMAFRTSADARPSRLCSSLLYLWIAQNVFLTGSAFWRLNLYVEVFSLTLMRVAAAIWMVLVALGLIWICASIIARRSNSWLVNVNIATLAATLLLCSFIDLPGFVARYNVQHCREVTGHGTQLDMAYLGRLGPAAIPALQWLHAEVEDQPELTIRVDRQLRSMNRALDSQLRNWRGWSWRRHLLAADRDGDE